MADGVTAGPPQGSCEYQILSALHMADTQIEVHNSCESSLFRQGGGKQPINIVTEHKNQP